MDEKLAEILQAPPDPERPYVYPGTETHINKFGILNPDALERVARTVTNLRQALLLANPIRGQFDLEHLCAIHHFLFQDIYEWAGQTRVVDFNRIGIVDPAAHLAKMDVDPAIISRMGPPFSRLADVVPKMTHLLEELKTERFLRGLEDAEFAGRLAHYLERLYHVHPFRDGNGRTIRLFLGQLAAENGWTFDMESAPQLERHMTAYAAHSGDKEPLSRLVRQSLRRNAS